MFTQDRKQTKRMIYWLSKCGRCVGRVLHLYDNILESLSQSCLHTIWCFRYGRQSSSHFELIYISEVFCVTLPWAELSVCGRSRNIGCLNVNMLPWKVTVGKCVEVTIHRKPRENSGNKTSLYKSKRCLHHLIMNYSVTLLVHNTEIKSNLLKTRMRDSLYAPLLQSY